MFLQGGIAHYTSLRELVGFEGGFGPLASVPTLGRLAIALEVSMRSVKEVSLSREYNRRRMAEVREELGAEMLSEDRRLELEYCLDHMWFLEGVLKYVLNNAGGKLVCRVPTYEEITTSPSCLLICEPFAQVEKVLSEKAHSNTVA